MTTTTTTHPDPTVLRDAVISTLITLLAPPPPVATPATLDAVTRTRQELATFHRHTNPARREARDGDRVATLTVALGGIARALLTTHPTHPPRLRAELSVLATVALAWLDTLPHPGPESDGGADEDPDLDDEPLEVEPF